MRNVKIKIDRRGSGEGIKVKEVRNISKWGGSPQNHLCGFDLHGALIVFPESWIITKKEKNMRSKKNRFVETALSYESLMGSGYGGYVGVRTPIGLWVFRGAGKYTLLCWGNGQPVLACILNY